MTIQFTLLKDSLSEILRQSTDFGALFYERLFTHYPQLQRLFAHTDMQAQHTRFLVALFQVLDHSTPARIEEVVGGLAQLGERHRGYNVQPEHFPIVGDILLSTLADVLADKWTPEVEQAWADAYAAMTQAMLQAPSSEQAPINPSDMTVSSKLHWWLGSHS